MIELKNVSIRRDGRVLFSDVNLQIHPKFKIGLTGNNGTGKSSFFALLLGELGLDSGEMTIPKDWQIGHMAQEIESSDKTALDFVLTGDKLWYELNQKIQNPVGIVEHELAKIHSQFDDIDGYRMPAKALTIMAGLGFASGDEQRSVSSFSGGWRMRLNLAKTLMSRADLLLLDEPTNHLDLDAILWLEEWLLAYDGALLVISHDQAFLDAVVGRILHIEQGAMTLYTGNYSTFLRTRAERLAQVQIAYEKQQATKAHLENFIRRFKAKATKAKQAQSRIKQLERMTELAPVMADNPFSFEFYPPNQLTSPLLIMDNVSVGYDDKPLITKLTLQITPDTRLGILGMNGAGKSTVIKALAGELPLMAGTRKVADSLVLGYFNQHQMDALDMNATPMILLRRLAGTTSDAVLRAFLGSFDFKGDRIDTEVSLFSGGEKARLTLALIVWQRPNLLVLDEPTNHLDLQMKDALTLALQNFDGAVILVSHDREMIANVCDELYLVHNGLCQPFDDDIKAYSDWLKNAKKQSLESKKTPQNNDKENKLSKEEQRKKSADLRAKTAPIRKQIDKDEKSLEKLAEQLQTIEEQLSDTSLYNDDKKADLLKLIELQTSLKNQIGEIEENLMNLMMELEEMEQSN